jgi:dolichyl-phosphate-mannose-protein mannosyltransferase
MTMSALRARASALAETPAWRWVVPTLLTLLTAALYLARLDEPARIIFDETYYVNDARQYLELLVEDGFAVHPPVGKWLIALGIALFGDGPTGWRIVGAAAGTATVLLTYLVGLRLFRSVGYAALAALLLATDGLFLVQARTSMLDIFLAFFIALGAWLLLLDHDRTGLDHAPPTTDPFTADGGEPSAVADDAPPTLPRRSHALRLAAGVVLGLAIATKWSGLFALGAAGVLSLGWELIHRRRWTGRWLVRLRPLVASLALAFVLAPAAVYAISYVPWLVNYEYSHEGRKECETDEGEVQDPCDVGLTGRVAGLWRYQKSIYRFHDTLEATHPYRAPATTWPIMGRPVVYYWETCSEDRANGVLKTDDETGEVTEPEPCVVERRQAAEIIAVGNPMLWWGFLAGSALLVAGLVRRDRTAAVITAFYAFQVLPWLVVPRPVFFFYMVPVVPFMALGLTYAVWAVGQRRAVERTLVGALVGGIGLGLGALAAPGIVGLSWLWWLTVGSVAGAVAGAWGDQRYDGTTAQLRAGPTPGQWMGVGIAVVAVALFVYFLPVWTGIPMSDDLVRQRWWLDTWI